MGFIESKEYEEAFDAFGKHVSGFKTQILDSDINSYDLKLPTYLRKFTANSVLVKCLSIYANEILQRLKKYSEANGIFEFLLFEQNVYLMNSRACWFERLSLNLETHLKQPVEAYSVLEKGLADMVYVKKAGRLALYQRLIKMKQTKRYASIKELKDKFKYEYQNVEKYDFIVAPTVEIEGTILHSEFIPGRKNIFIQNFEDDDDVYDSHSTAASKSEQSVDVDEENSHQSATRYDVLSVFFYQNFFEAVFKWVRIIVSV